MINYFDIPEDNLPMSMRFFRKALQERGWKAEKLYASGANDLILTRPDGRELRVASSTPPTTSVFALHLADDKLASHALLESIGVSQPETKVIESVEMARDFLRKHGEIVIKPADGAHGRGITVGITREEQIEPAIQKALDASQKMELAIMQPRLPSGALEIRVLCINYQFVLAIARIPAQVTGDGERSVIELIDLENQTIRAAPYHSNLAYIDREMALIYLGEHANDIPQTGEKVQVVASCNVGQGGTTEDYSLKISDEMKLVAEKIARAAQLPVVGIDFYDDQVLEINACPSLYYPTGDDAATKAVEAYINYLERL